MKLTKQQLEKLIQDLAQKLAPIEGLPHTTVKTIRETALIFEAKIKELNDKVRNAKGFDAFAKAQEKEYKYFCEKNKVKCNEMGHMPPQHQDAWTEALKKVATKHKGAVDVITKIEVTAIDVEFPQISDFTGMPAIHLLNASELFNLK